MALSQCEKSTTCAIFPIQLHGFVNMPRQKLHFLDPGMKLPPWLNALMQATSNCLACYSDVLFFKLEHVTHGVLISNLRSRRLAECCGRINVDVSLFCSCKCGQRMGDWQRPKRSNVHKGVQTCSYCPGVALEPLWGFASFHFKCVRCI